jgi:hypothetical protein
MLSFLCHLLYSFCMYSYRNKAISPNPMYCTTQYVHTSETLAYYHYHIEKTPTATILSVLCYCHTN